MVKMGVIALFSAAPTEGGQDALNLSWHLATTDCVKTTARVTTVLKARSKILTYRA